MESSTTFHVFSKGKGNKLNILSIGMNHPNSIITYPSIHAEEDAIRKLKPLSPKKHLKRINLLVVRMSSSSYNYQSSKPCSHCIDLMASSLLQKGYCLHHVFYSDGKDIIKTTLTALAKEENRHVSMFYRHHLPKNMNG